MLKLVIPALFATPFIVIGDALTTKVFAKCAARNEGIYTSIVSKIDDSQIADTRILKCEEVEAINEISADSLLITSGRKRGKYTICLSDDALNPCKFVVGVFNDNKNPSQMLSQVFGLKEKRRIQLNETVERLFFKPSLLID